MCGQLQQIRCRSTSLEAQCVLPPYRRTGGHGAFRAPPQTANLIVAETEGGLA